MELLASASLTLGVTDIKAARAKWQMLLDRPDRQSGDLYRFSIGPALPLVAATTDGFTGMVLASAFVAKGEGIPYSWNLLRKSTDNTVAIDPLALGGFA